MVKNIFRQFCFANRNIFYTFVTTINTVSTMVRTDILSNSLFDEFKPPFEASDFQDEIISPEFQRGIFVAHQKGFGDALQLKGKCTSITTAGITHDCTYHYLESELSPLGFEFVSDSAGNKRAFFTKGDYIFILKKKDAPTNPTGISRNIREQNVSKHVITISYETDPLGIEVARIFVQYLRGNTVEYSFTITPEDGWGISHTPSTILPTEGEHVKPKLKIKKNDVI